MTRDYVLELDAVGPPALSVFGGKLTTFAGWLSRRWRGSHRICRKSGPAWTAGSILPGGEGLPAGGTAMLAADLAREYPFLDEQTAARLAGVTVPMPAAPAWRARRPADLGQDFGHGFSEAELRWMVEREWAGTAEDVLWRRSKLGLRMTPPQARALTGFSAKWRYPRRWRVKRE